MIYFVIYGILLFVAVGGYFKTGVRLSLFNIYFGLFLLFYGPAFFIYNNNLNLFETDYAQKATCMLMLFLVSFFFGRYLFLKSKKGIEKTVNYYNWVSLPENNDFVLRAGILKMLLLVIAAIVFTGLIFYGGITSLVKAVNSPYPDEAEISGLRGEAGVSGWIAPIYTYVLTGIARLASFLFIGWAFKKRSLILKTISICYALFISIAYLANLSKSGFVVFVGQLVFFLLLLNNVKINYKKVVLILAIIFPLLIGVYLVATNAGNSSGAVDLLLSRIFEEPNRVLLLYPYYYPDILPYTYGMNIRVIHGMFSDAPFAAANVLVSGSQFNHVTFNAMFIADAYVDFSYIGVVIQSIIVGYYLSFLDILVFRKNNYIQKALFAALLIGIFNLINTGLIVSFFAFGLLTLPVFTWLLVKTKKKNFIFKSTAIADVRPSLK